MPDTPSPSSASRAPDEMLAMLRLATPLASANLLQMAVGAVDVMFVARLGDRPLAASTLAVSLFLLMMWCFWGISGAVAPVVAAELGARAHAVREVRRSVRMALWLGLALGLLGMAITTRFDLIMAATGQQPQVAALAASFAQVIKWSMVPMVVSSVLRSVVAALGRPAYATAITVLSLLSNVCGNYALVFGHWGAPALGLNGAAFATVITSVVTVLAYLAALRLDRRLRRYRLLGRWWRPEWPRLWQVLRLGAPIGLIVLAEGGLFNSAAFLMGRIGVTALAGHAVAIQIAALAFQVPFGVGQAATIRVGYHFGAGDAVAIGKAGRAAMLVGLGFACLNALAMIAAPRLVISAYVDAMAPANAALVALAIRYLRIAAGFQLADAVQTIAAGSLRGLQDTAMPAAIAIAGYWLAGFVTALWLGLYTPLAGVGVWVGLLVGLVMVAILLAWRWQQRGALGLLPGQ